PVRLGAVGPGSGKPNAMDGRYTRESQLNSPHHSLRRDRAVAAAGAEAPQSVSESVLLVPALPHHVRAPLPRALSGGVFTVAMDVSGLPPFALRTHKGWGTRSCVNTQLENAVAVGSCHLILYSHVWLNRQAR